MIKLMTPILFVLFAVPALAQNYPEVSSSTTHINFANRYGSPLFPGQVGEAKVTLSIARGPVTFKQISPLCIPKPGAPGEYAAECDDVKMDKGCTGTWQTGDQCTITFSIVADGDDNRCDVTGPNPAYSDGCEGIIQIKVPNSPNIIRINYSYQWADPAPQIRVTPARLSFPETSVSTDEPPTMTSEILNPGNVPLNISSIAITSGTAFAIESMDCPNPLPAQQSCDVTVSFTPTKVGPNNGTIRISDNSGNPNAPKNIYLIGTGMKP